jgi:hypothetical protein
MKIALCLSGHMRSFERTYPTLYFYLLKNHDVDIFIHTWDKLGFSCQFKTDNMLNDTSEKLDQIHNLYKPKSIIVESSSFVEELKRQGNEYAPHLANEPKHVGHMAAMFYKIYAANAIRKKYQLETGTEYDWVIRCRPDLLFSNEITLPLEKKPETIWLPQSSCSPGWYNDQFAIGSSDDMDLYSSAFFDISEYFKSKNEFYPEKFMVWTLNKKNLKVDWCNAQFSIHR